jgi:hypothetical protein
MKRKPHRGKDGRFISNAAFQRRRSNGNKQKRSRVSPETNPRHSRRVDSAATASGKNVARRPAHSGRESKSNAPVRDSAPAASSSSRKSVGSGRFRDLKGRFVSAKKAETLANQGKLGRHGSKPRKPAASYTRSVNKLKKQKRKERKARKPIAPLDELETLGGEFLGERELRTHDIVREYQIPWPDEMTLGLMIDNELASGEPSMSFRIVACIPDDLTGKPFWIGTHYFAVAKHNIKHALDEWNELVMKDSIYWKIKQLAFIMVRFSMGR